jgi:hypothetical protein
MAFNEFIVSVVRGPLQLAASVLGADDDLVWHAARVGSREPDCPASVAQQHMNSDVQIEQRVIMRSARAGVFAAVLGIGFFLVTKSQAIMLDGFFSIIAVGVDLLTIRVAGLVSQPDDRSFQFGYGMF